MKRKDEAVDRLQADAEFFEKEVTKASGALREKRRILEASRYALETRQELGALRERRRIIEDLAEALGELHAMGAHCFDDGEDYAALVEYIADRVWSASATDAQTFIDAALEAGRE